MMSATTLEEFLATVRDGLLGASVRFTTLSKYFTKSVVYASLLEQLV